jgi:hypothetical protein
MGAIPSPSRTSSVLPMAVLRGLAMARYHHHGRGTACHQRPDFFTTKERAYSWLFGRNANVFTWAKVIGVMSSQKKTKERQERAYSWQKSGPTAGNSPHPPGRPVGQVLVSWPAAISATWMTSHKGVGSLILDSCSMASSAAGLLPQAGHFLFDACEFITTLLGTPPLCVFRVFVVSLPPVSGWVLCWVGPYVFSPSPSVPPSVLCWTLPFSW